MGCNCLITFRTINIFFKKLKSDHDDEMNYKSQSYKVILSLTLGVFPSRAARKSGRKYVTFISLCTDLDEENKEMVQRLLRMGSPRNNRKVTGFGGRNKNDLLKIDLRELSANRLI